MSYRSYTAHYLDPFVADVLVTELVLPSSVPSHSLATELVLPDGVVPVPLEMAPDPAMITISTAGQPFAAMPRPRVRISRIFAGDNEDWIPSYFVPLAHTGGLETTRPGDVIVAIIAARDDLSSVPPTGFSLLDSHVMTDETLGDLFLGVFTRRIQVGESTEWPTAYGEGWAGSNGFAAYVAYNISGALDPSNFQVQFDEHEADGADTASNSTVAGDGEVGIVALASRPGVPNIGPGNPSDSGDGYDSDGYIHAAVGEFFVGVARTDPFLGSAGSGADWIAAGPIGMAVTMTLILSATPILTDDGAGAAVGVRMPTA